MATAYVQGAKAMQWSGTSLAVALNGVSAGSVLAVYVYWGDPTATCSLADSKSQSYTVKHGATTLASQGRSSLWYAKNVAAGNTTITATISASAFAVIEVHEISGCDTTEPYDTSAVNAQTDPGTGANAVTSGSITPSVNGCYLFGATQAVAGTSATINADWTSRQTQNGMYSGDIVQTSAGAKAFTATGSNAFEDYISIIVAFKPPAAAGTSISRLIFNLSERRRRM